MKKWLSQEKGHACAVNLPSSGRTCTPLEKVKGHFLTNFTLDSSNLFRFPLKLPVIGIHVSGDLCVPRPRIDASIYDFRCKIYVKTCKMQV